MKPLPPVAGEKVGCIVLAAGSSKRFGTDKRFYPLPSGKSMLSTTLEMLEPLFSERVLVLKPGEHEVASAFRKHWQVVFASDAAKGMGHSLAAAMPVVSHWQGAVIALADMPFVNPSSVVRIKAAVARNTLVVPYCHDQRGNPVGIGSDYFQELAALQGDSGARQLMQQYSARIVRLDIDDEGLLKDLDSPPT